MRIKVEYFQENGYTTQYYYKSPIKALRRYRWVTDEVPNLEHVGIGIITG